MMGCASAVDPGAKISAVGKLLLDSDSPPPPPPPPLRLKVERQGGSGIVFIAVDPGALIWTVEEVRPAIPDPPPPPRLKVERRGGGGGGSGIHMCR
jgi:hypothetical protein